MDEAPQPNSVLPVGPALDDLPPAPARPPSPGAQCHPGDRVGAVCIWQTEAPKQTSFICPSLGLFLQEPLCVVGLMNGGELFALCKVLQLLLAHL